MNIQPGETHLSSEENFRRYEASIKQVLDRYPKPTIWFIQSIKPETFVNGIRAAYRYFIHPNCIWHSEILDRARMAEIRHALIFLSQRPNRVYVGPPDKRLEAPAHSTVEEHLRLIDGSDIVTVRAFAHLRSLGHINSLVKFADLSQETISEIFNNYPNVILSQEDDGTYLMI